jgi:hypothetical protein
MFRVSPRFCVSFPIGLVVIVLIVLDGAKQLEDPELLPPSDILLQCDSDGLFVRRVPTEKASLGEELVVDRQGRQHRFLLLTPYLF